MKPSLFAHSAISLALVSLFGSAWAQTAAPAPAPDVRRSIEDTQSKLPARAATKGPKLELQDPADATPMSMLDAVQVKSDKLRPQIEAYWAEAVGKPVTADQINAFRAWVNETARRQGYMAYAQTTPRGNILAIELVVPRINTVRVFARDQELAKRYLAEVQSRFLKGFKPGDVVDPTALEQQLDAVSFTKPLDVEVTIRSAGPELLDLVIDVSEAPSRPGEVLGGLVQFNNYGLKQYGVEQLLAQVSIGGPSPTSRLTLTGQKSNQDGINYMRADYDTPVDWLDSRFHMSLSSSQNKTVLGGTSTVKNDYTELLLGFERILGFRGEAVVKGTLDVSSRYSKSRLAINDTQLSDVKNDEYRVRLSMDSDRLSPEPMRVDATASLGNYDRLGGTPNVPGGTYSRFEFNGRKQLNLSSDGRWFTVGKVRGQFASARLDSGNRMALGGVNGVRAYTSVDGLGDEGLLVAVDVSYRYEPTHAVGVFYDAGAVRTLGPQVSSDPYGGTPITLQSAGFQFNGNLDRLYYVFSVAKGFGGNNGFVPSNVMESTPDNWRANGALTLVF